MPRKTIDERIEQNLKERERIEAELTKLKKKKMERIAKIAIAAGIGDLKIDDATLYREFEAIARRFRDAKGAQPASPPPADSPG